jgi:hypothetical protein
MGWAGHAAKIGRGGMHIGYWWRARRKEPLRITKSVWVRNIRIELRENGAM